MLLDARLEHGTPPDVPARRAGSPAGVPASPPTLSSILASAVDDDLPPELSFLLAQGVAPGLLRRAARVAEELGVPGEDALFGLGFPDDRYARLLARHLGAPCLTRPPALAREHLDAVAAAELGWAPLAFAPGAPAHVFAPRGAALRLLLDEHRFDDVGTYGFAVTTRRRFEALLRRHDAAAFRERIASGLAGWDADLSARGGATRAQKGAALAFASASAAGFAHAPGATGTSLAVALLAVFAAAVAQRLLVVAAGLRSASDRPGPPLRDRDLPVYTLIVPLFREARVLPALVRALDALDYPVLCISLT